MYAELLAHSQGPPFLQPGQLGDQIPMDVSSNNRGPGDASRQQADSAQSAAAAQPAAIAPDSSATSVSIRRPGLHYPTPHRACCPYAIFCQLTNQWSSALKDCTTLGSAGQMVKANPTIRAPLSRLKYVQVLRLEERSRLAGRRRKAAASP